MKLLDQLVAERAEIATAVEAVLDRAAEETRDLTETEDSNLADLTTRAKTIDARIADLREIQISHLEAAKLRAEVAAEHKAELDAQKEAADAEIREIREKTQVEIASQLRSRLLQLAAQKRS